MESNLKLGIGAYTDVKTNLKGARIEVTNAGEESIKEIKFSFDYEFETPRDASPEFSTATPIDVHEIGRSFWFNIADGQANGPLAAGATRVYLLPVEWTNQMKSVVQSLSPEKYSIKAIVDGKEETAIPGPHWGDMVQRLLPDSEPDARQLSREQIQRLGMIVQRIFALRRGFKVFPPKELAENPDLLNDLKISEKLLHTNWWVKLHDGSEELLTYPELLALVYEIRTLKSQIDRAMSDPNRQEGTIQLNFKLAMAKLFQPKTAQLLLRTLELEGLQVPVVTDNVADQIIEQAVPDIQAMHQRWLDAGLGSPFIFILQHSDKVGRAIAEHCIPPAELQAHTADADGGAAVGWVGTVLHPLAPKEAMAVIKKFLPKLESFDFGIQVPDTVWVILVAFDGFGTYQIRRETRRKAE